MEDHVMRYSIAALLSAVLLASGPAIACDSLGENMHMGNIVSIDRSGNTFTILDAESQAPIRFIASRESLIPLSVNDMVEVSYEVIEGGGLRILNLVRM
jgi:hypothetical protein